MEVRAAPGFKSKMTSEEGESKKCCISESHRQQVSRAQAKIDISRSMRK
jgi:hypothetical protein